MTRLSAKATPLLPTYVENRMHSVIMPVEYASACRAIAKCRNLDEGKHWADKADALAAWAKIYKQNDTLVEAKRLKLHAYRRMNEIAEELQPTETKIIRAKGRFNQPAGARQLLKEHGLSNETVKHVRRIGAIPKEKFEQILNMPRPPGISAVSAIGVGRSGRPNRRVSSEAWRLLTEGSVLGGCNLRRFNQLFCKHQSAKELACGLHPGELIAAHQLLTEVLEWLDEFERYLPRQPTHGTSGEALRTGKA